MRPLHVAGILTLAAVWGSSYLFIKIGLRDFSPGSLVFLRAAVAAALLGAIVAASGPGSRAALRSMSARPGRFFLLGLTQVALPFLLISAGETEVDSGLTAVLGATVPLCIAAVAPFADPTERATRRRLTGMVIGLVGVGVVVGAESVGSLGEAVGSLAILGASMSYAIGSFVATRLFIGVPPMVKSFCAVAGGGILIAPLALLTLPDETPSAGPVLAVLALAVGGTALAFILLYALMDRIGPGRVALNTYLIPVFALAYGAAFLDERLGPPAFGGLVLVLVGVAIAGRDDRVVETVAV
jgi:drug/metabolite transporter (DMT)-like permease